jgi:hypothetical protein
MSFYHGKFIPNGTIVANEQHNKVSLLCQEWLINLNDNKVLTEKELSDLLGKHNMSIKDLEVTVK